jgi:hypothetical protein
MSFFDGGQHNFLICAQSNCLLKFFINIAEIIHVPIEVAVQYSHRFSTIPPDNKAGANERAEFIRSPDTKAKKNMSKLTTAPITVSLKHL